MNQIKSNELIEINGGFSKKGALAIGGAVGLVVVAPVAAALAPVAGATAAFGGAYVAGASLLAASLS